MKEFENLTLKEINNKIKELSSLNCYLDNLLKSVLELEKRFADYGIDGKLYKLDIVQKSDTKDKFDTIKYFLEENYSETIMYSIKLQKESCRKWVKEQEARIAKTFEILQAKEEMLNKQIAESLTTK
jgi:hypothetical protein